MTTKANYLRFFRIFGYCIAGYWLFILCPLFIRSLMYEGALDLTGGLILACIFLGFPVTMSVVSHAFPRPGFRWRVMEVLLLLLVTALLVPNLIEFIHAPANNVYLLVFLIPLGLYLVMFVGAILIRGRPSSGISKAVVPEER